MKALTAISRINYAFFLLGLSLCWSLIHLSFQASELPPYTNTPQDRLLISLPNFSSINDVKQKKRDFFTYLLPMIKSENQHILKLRVTVDSFRERLRKQNENTFSESEEIWIKGLATQYGVPNDNIKETINGLLLSLDAIPVSLALAQAAIESGWGTSRFAKQGNNLFGHWCFKKGCGIVPLSRTENQHHEVARFDTVNSSIRAYLKNLNSFSAYAEFRRLRKELRSPANTPVKSIDLLSSLSSYSEQGVVYINKVRSVIVGNKLSIYDLSG